MSAITAVWYDDLRSPPAGWFWAKTFADATTAFTENEILDASLDYGMGYAYSHEGDQPIGVPGQSPPNAGQTGLDLLEWISINNKWPTHSLAVHTSDTVNGTLMRQYIGLHGIYSTSEIGKIACGGQFGFVNATIFINRPSEFIQPVVPFPL